ncbi:MAG TPA: adenosylcobinamide-GDP ribazoletransferase [Negativicutes bacterium]|nr:adenosylcobinamide-GDP ribazoletransferase [Negativicutes bacterium]
MIYEFLTALQFLTRIRLVSATEYDEEMFGRSVRFFPLVGMVAGGILALVVFLSGGWMPGTIRSTLLVTLCIFITGGLHCDGLMDTADGLFSGRSRERMLEIMKDSRVGAFGVLSIILLLLWKWSLIYDMPDSLLGAAMISMMTISRFTMVLAILRFPYARAEGMGKAFARHAGKGSLGLAIVTLAAFLGGLYFIMGSLVFFVASGSAVVAILFAFWFGNWATRKIGGLTGDTYGAMTELSELVVLTVFVLSTYVRWVR